MRWTFEIVLACLAYDSCARRVQQSASRVTALAQANIHRKSAPSVLATLLAASNLTTAFNSRRPMVHSPMRGPHLAGHNRIDFQSPIMKLKVVPEELAPFLDREAREAHRIKSERTGMNKMPLLFAKSARYDRNHKWAGLRKENETLMQSIKDKYKNKKVWKPYLQKKRVPKQRWESEGNAFFMKATNNLTTKQLIQSFEHLSLEDAMAHAESMLSTRASRKVERLQREVRRLEATENSAPPDSSRSESSPGDVDADAAGHPLMWGSIPVGPTLKSRLVALGMPTPLPIQKETWIPITKGKNVVIGSATGSGKTLAFLVPLLATTSRARPCSILILVASKNLAQQIKAVIEGLWPPKDDSAAAHVVDDDTSPNKLINIGNASVLIGTPKALRQVMAQARDALSASVGMAPSNLRIKRVSETDGLDQALMLESNLKKVVIDEADELLNTAYLAQQAELRKDFKYGQRNLMEQDQELLARRRFQGTDAEQLLLDLPKKLSEVQLVCASATAGRTLRGQLQGILDAPSIDKATTLVSTGRNVKKKSNLRPEWTPSTLGHSYMLMEPVEDDGPWASQSSFFIRRAMEHLKPGPAIIFTEPRRIKPLAAALMEDGLNNVRQLKHAHDEALMVREAAQWPRHVLNMKSPHDALEEMSWAAAPVFIGSQEDSRGIDLVIDYVFMSSAPTSSADYTHAAGRAGRNGRQGLAITLLTPQQAPHLVQFSDQLEISFTRIGGSSNEQDNFEDSQEVHHEREVQELQEDEVVDKSSPGLPDKLGEVVAESSQSPQDSEQEDEAKEDTAVGKTAPGLLAELGEVVAESSQSLQESKHEDNAEEDDAVGKSASGLLAELDEVEAESSHSLQESEHEDHVEEDDAVGKSASGFPAELNEAVAESQQSPQASEHEGKAEENDTVEKSASGLPAELGEVVAESSQSLQDSDHEDAAEEDDAVGKSASGPLAEPDGVVAERSQSLQESEHEDHVEESDAVGKFASGFPAELNEVEAESSQSLQESKHEDNAEEDDVVGKSASSLLAELDEVVAESPQSPQASEHEGKADEDDVVGKSALSLLAGLDEIIAETSKASQESEQEAEAEQDDVVAKSASGRLAKLDERVADNSLSLQDSGRDGENDQDLQSLTVTILKDKLRAHGLKVSGKKAELIHRLEEHAANI